MLLLYLLVSVCEILAEESLCLVDLEEDALELLELFRITSVGSDRCDFLSDGKYSLELKLKVFPKGVT